MSDFEAVLGDTLKILEVTVEDENRNAQVLTGGEVRLFALGANGDRPATVANITRTGAITTGSTAVTISPTSLLVGMRVIGIGIPDGTEIAAVGAGITLSRPATATNGTASLVFWNGLLGDITTGGIGATGRAWFQGIGSKIDLTTFDEVRYAFRVRYKTSGALVGWSEADYFYGRVAGD